MGQYDSLVGELQPGQSGWLPLDAAGIPSGPASVVPPDFSPDARAAYVLRPHSGPDQLVSATGAPLIGNLNSNIEKRVPPPPIPTIISVTPNTAEIGSADVTMVVEGTNFTQTDSVILFNGGVEPTTFIDETHVSTVVKPSLASMPIEVPVHVRNIDQMSNPGTFAFTAPPPEPEE